MPFAEISHANFPPSLFLGFRNNNTPALFFGINIAKSLPPKKTPRRSGVWSLDCHCLMDLDFGAARSPLFLLVARMHINHLPTSFLLPRAPLSVNQWAFSIVSPQLIDSFGSAFLPHQCTPSLRHAIQTAIHSSCIHQRGVSNRMRAVPLFSPGRFFLSGRVFQNGGTGFSFCWFCRACCQWFSARLHPQHRL